MIGLALSVMVTGSQSLLPQTRLKSSAENLASTVESARSWAVLEGRPLEICYDLDAQTYAVWLPFATDDEGDAIGPGRTDRIPASPPESGMVIAEVRLAGGLVRDKGQVILEVSPMGRVPSHEVVVVNSEHRETEAMTVRVNGLANRCQVIPGDVTMEGLTDVDFR